MEIVDPELLWAVGLFEGEGCIAVYPERDQIYLCMASTDLDVLERFRALIGGSIYKQHRRNREDKGHKPCWRWQSTRKSDVERILADFLPWLGERRTAKAEEALEGLKRTNHLRGWELRRARYGHSGRRHAVA